ncbi:MAG: FapA family protein [Acidobacteriota bacterium]|nr:FapA family protein [Acidobacteriota bacterium]
MDGTLFPHMRSSCVVTHAAFNASATALLILLAAAVTFGAPDIGRAAQESEAPLVIDGDHIGDVFGLGRSVVVRGNVRRGVVSFGGDVIVEGRVEGDVAAVGGSVRQREGSFIGGDVIVVGGTYHHGRTAPGRNPASKVLMYAGYEAELREMARNPASLLTPRLSPIYFGQRLLSLLFWFVTSLVLTAVSPGAVSRGAARLQLTSLRVAVIGLLGAVVLIFGGTVSLYFLPPTLGTLVGAMTLLLLLVAYLFGRVVINAATGRWLQRLFFAEENRSESVALLLGAAFWAVALALPYAWLFIVGGLVVTSLGLALTARYGLGRKRA